MKIVYLLPGGLFNSAGMERVMTIKANYLVETLGYEVFIVTTEQMGQPVFYPLSPKVNLCHLDLHFTKNFETENYIQKIISRFFKIRKYKHKLSELLKEIRPDITITTLGGLDIEFLNDLKDGSIKIGELHFPGNYRQIQARKMYSSYFPRLVGKIRSANFIRNCKKLKRLIVLTEEEKSLWSGVNNMLVIPNPLPFVPEKFSTTENKKAIAVGRLAYEKGFDMLIEAWTFVAEKHPDWELNIYGNGNQKENLSKLIGEKKLDGKVKLHKPVRDIQTQYSEHSMLIFPTRYLDSFGMVIIEAMSCGVPPVAYNAPCGPKDLISDGVNGFLVEVEDIKGLAAKINELIESDGLRQTMGEAAKKFSSNFQIEKIMKHWDQLFKELVNEKNSRIGN
jgi:glycosyltransferase involved in cell wall biosynthesis